MGKIKRILFLRTPVSYPPGSNSINAPLIPPLGMAIITANLRSNGYEVIQDDLNIKAAYRNRERDRLGFNSINNAKKVIDYLKGQNKAFDKLAKNVLRMTKIKNPDIIFLSAPNSLYDQNSLRLLLILSKYIKKKYHVPIVVGSESDNLMNISSFAFGNELVDYIIYGPGEIAATKLLKALNRNKEMANVPGLVYKRSNRILINNAADPKLSVIPDFDGLPLELYQWKKGGKKMIIIPYRFIYGCPNNCAFCTSSKEKCVKILDVGKAVNAIIELSKKYDSYYFMFLNNYINISKKYAKDFCRKLIDKKANIMWSDCAFANNTDVELIDLMKESGCIRLIFGFETGSTRLLKSMDKPLSLSRLSSMLRHSHKKGIWNGIEVIAGLPGETHKDLNDTIEYMKKNHNLIDEVYINRFRAIPGSAIAINPAKYGLKKFKMPKDEELLSANNYFSVSSGQYAEDNKSWDQKKKLILKHERILREAFRQKSFMLAQEQLNILFYLYNKYKTKTNVRKMHQRIMKREYRKMMMNTKALRWHLKNSSIKDIVKKAIVALS